MPDFAPFGGERNPLSTVGGCDEESPRAWWCITTKALGIPSLERGFLSGKIGHLKDVVGGSCQGGRSGSPYGSPTIGIVGGTKTAATTPAPPWQELRCPILPLLGERGTLFRR